MTRQNQQCPRCHRRESVFVARSSKTQAWYRCMNNRGKSACGKWFEAEHPKPLHKHVPTIELKEAA